MKCLRCGWCCKNLCVIVVNDPNKGIQEGNLITHEGNGKSCPHLKGTAGKYECAIHNEPWYEETPCAQYTQIGKEGEPCRMGLYQGGIK